MVFKHYQICRITDMVFENDVKMYGIQTLFFFFFWLVCSFENDVKMYGIQTQKRLWRLLVVFENDVKMYGIQTEIVI